MMRLHLVVPGALASLTGGYVYDRYFSETLRARGHEVYVHELPAALPGTGEAGDRALREVFSQLEDGALVVVDGLAGGDHPRALLEHANRLRFVALVHHPLAWETGLDDTVRERLFVHEKRALSACRGILCTSEHTRDVLVAEFGTTPSVVETVLPGVRLPVLARDDEREAPPWRLLCVATLTARKGHLVLLDALERLNDGSWSLRCIGSDGHDPEHAAAIRGSCDRLGLTSRVTWEGEVDDWTLMTAYAEADLFVLASLYEGYGMVLAEALSHRLPVVGTRAGAIVQTVPADAGILVEPGDAQALSEAIERFLTDPATRRTLREGAHRAARASRGWDAVAVEWDAALVRFSAI